MDNLKVKVASDVVDKNFLGTYLTENGSTAVVVSRSAMVVDGKKQIIWVGFVFKEDETNIPQFNVWDKDGRSIPKTLKHFAFWDLKEAVRETAY